MTTPSLRVVPASEASWADLDAVFGTTGDPAGCHCQWFKVPRGELGAMSGEQRRALLREQTHCGDPSARETSGLVAYLDDEPAGWVAVEPRPAYPRLATRRVPWAGRDEDPADPRVWAVTCFVVRKGFRRRGVMAALAQATIGFVRDRGARALEAYPMVTEPEARLQAGELFVGAARVFADAGFAEVSHPTPRRVVMRVDL
jgi:GNAT superfamily N-acetyltransferase